jgi:hypothetical protein
MKHSLRSRIFAILGIIAAASLLVIWIVLRPKYEEMAVAERLAEIRRLQLFAVENLDRAITERSRDVEIIASQVAERPKEGEAVLRTMMALRPDIIQVKIRSANLSDELVSQNMAYPPVSLQVSDSAWISSKQNSTIRYAWLVRSEPPKQLFVVQRQMSIQNRPFVMTVLWDAKRLNDIFAELPLDRDYSTGIVSRSAVLVHDTSGSFNFNKMLGTLDGARDAPNTGQEETSWKILTSSFPSVRLWLVIAIPERTITGPVRELMLYSTSLIVGLTIILLILGWLLAHQARRSRHKPEPAADSGSNQ